MEAWGLGDWGCNGIKWFLIKLTCKMRKFDSVGMFGFGRCVILQSVCIRGMVLEQGPALFTLNVCSARIVIGRCSFPSFLFFN
jgi:hypothetical protein